MIRKGDTYIRTFGTKRDRQYTARATSDQHPDTDYVCGVVTEAPAVSPYRVGQAVTSPVDSCQRIIGSEPILDGRALADQVNALGAKLARTERKLAYVETDRDGALRRERALRVSNRASLRKLAARDARIRDLERTTAERSPTIDDYLERALAQVQQQKAAEVQEANNRTARQIAETSRMQDRAVKAENENIRLKAAVASTQTHLGNLVRDIHGSC